MELTYKQVEDSVRGADLARLLQRDGKRVRDRIRKAGVYVSKGGTLTTPLKVIVAESFGATVKGVPADTRKAIDALKAQASK